MTYRTFIISSGVWDEIFQKLVGDLLQIKLQRCRRTHDDITIQC